MSRNTENPDFGPYKQLDNNVAWIAIFIFYVIIVAALCFEPVPGDISLPSTFLGLPFDKVVHFLMFLPFTIIGTCAFRRRNYWRTLVWMTVLGVIVATSFELLQSVLTDYRTTDPWDLVSNLLAMFSGCAIMAVIGLFLKSNR